MENNNFCKPDKNNSSKMPSHAYRTGNDYIIYESHHMKNPRLPFIFDLQTVQRRTTSAYEDNDCFQYYKCEALNWHENPEFLYIAKGNGTIRCGVDTISAREGDIIIVNSNTTHGVCFDNDYEYYYLIIDKDFLSTNGIELSTLKFSTHIQSSEITEKFRKIISSYSKKDSFQEASIRCVILDFLISLCKEHQSMDNTLSITTKSMKNINIALGYIEANLSQKLTLEDIAFEVGLSKYHFSREFKKVTGKTVIDYINMRRCETAKRLLMNENCSVTETAEKCGFDNPTYFSETFKKHTGISPANFIKSAHADGKDK